MKNDENLSKNYNVKILIAIIVMIVVVLGAFFFGKSLGDVYQTNTTYNANEKENQNIEESEQPKQEEQQESNEIPQYDKYFFESYLKIFHVFNHANNIKEIDTNIINSTIRGLIYLEYNDAYEIAENGYNKVSVSKYDVNNLLKKYYNLENYKLKPNGFENGFATVSEDDYNYIVTWPSTGMGLAVEEEIIQAIYNGDEVNVKFAIHCKLWNGETSDKILGEEIVTLKYINNNFIIKKVTYNEIVEENLCDSL